MMRLSAARNLVYWSALAPSLAPNLVFAHAATSNTVLFDREIVRILDAHCIMCHAADGPAFPLASYEETWLKRDAIHDQTLARQMPPWAAVPGYGEFKNANRLTLREQRFVVSWVEGLGPRNDGVVFLNVLDPEAAAREEIRARPDFDRWVLGAPDLEIALPQAEPVGGDAASGQRRIQRTVVDLRLDTEAWIDGIEFLPRARDAIRAVVLTAEDSGQWLATWTPWHGVRELPSAAAYRLAAGARIVAEIHTTDAVDTLTDPGMLGLHVASDAAPSALRDVVLTAAGDVAPVGAPLRLHAETTLDAAMSLHALWPDLPASDESVEISSIEVAAVFPSGHVDVLLFALDIPVEWPTAYIYEAPVTLPAGTRISLTAYAARATSRRAGPPASAGLPASRPPRERGELELRLSVSAAAAASRAAAARASSARSDRSP